MGEEISQLMAARKGDGGRGQGQGIVLRDLLPPAIPHRPTLSTTSSSPFKLLIHPVLAC